MRGYNRMVGGTEVRVGFLPSWYYGNYGFACDERYYFDAEYRTRVDMEIDRAMWGRFPDLKLGDPDPRPQPCLPCCNGTIPALFGAHLRFAPDKFVWEEHVDVEEDEAARLTIPDVASTYPVRQFRDQAAYLFGQYGARVGTPTIQGPLNNALKVRGPEFLVDLLERPALAHYVLSVMAETMAEIVRLFDAFIDPTTYLPFLAECTVTMVAPATYRAVVYEHDRQFLHAVAGYRRLMIHHCGRIDEYLADYAGLSPTILHIGFRSNARKALDAFPGLPVIQLVSPVVLLNSGPQEVYSHVRELLAIGEGARDGRYGIDMADIELGTPDENVRAAFEAVRDHACQ